MQNIDLLALLAPCPGAHPGGRDLESGHELYALESAAKEPEEPGIKGVSAVDARDWPAIRRQAIVLLEQSKDLRPCVLLARALLHSDGVPGYAAALTLIRGLIERYWEHVYPSLEDDGRDADMRLNVLRELWNPHMLGRLRATIVVSSRELGAFSLNDVLLAKGASSARPSSAAATPQHVVHALASAPLQELTAAYEAVRSAVADLNALRGFIGEKLLSPSSFHPAPLVAGPDERPSGMLDQLELVLRERVATTTSDDERTRDETVVSPAAQPSEVTMGQSPPSSLRVSGEARTREDVLALLDQVCAYYAKHEPSSPVPLLVERAKRLATMSFLEIVRDLADKGLPQAEAWVRTASSEEE